MLIVTAGQEDVSMTELRVVGVRVIDDTGSAFRGCSNLLNVEGTQAERTEEWVSIHHAEHFLL